MVRVERDAHDYATALLLTPRARRLAGVMERTHLDDELDAVLGPMPTKIR
jgi:hypothetical protein